MKVTLESTNVLTRINGQLCRVWRGTTEGGIAVTVFVPRVAVNVDADRAEFERDLADAPPPRELDAATALQQSFSTRMF